jgi:hypothetical protein
MLKADIAESILSLTTTPERAASTAGDLEQEAPRRGPLWFWRVLLGTTASLVWQAWRVSPRRLAGLAFRACLIAFGISLVLGIGTVALVVLLGNSMSGLVPYKYLRSVILAGPFLSALIPQFLTGNWIARRARSNELAVCIGFLCLQQVPPAILLLLLSSPREVPATYAAVTILANAVPFAGIWWERRQSANMATSS